MKLLYTFLLIAVLTSTVCAASVSSKTPDVGDRVRRRRSLSDMIIADEARKGDDDDDDDDGGVPPTAPPAPVRQVATFPDIKLNGASEVAPFVGLPFAVGVAEVQVIYEEGRAGSEFLICIEAKILGFSPQLLHIHNAEIFENGAVFADLTSLLVDGTPETAGCVEISQQFYNILLANPNRFYVNAHVAASPDSLFLQGIRGQFIQQFKAILSPDTAVAPFMGVAGASGIATVSIENGGGILCFDAQIAGGFNPLVAVINFGAVGTNGDVVFNFSSTKVAVSTFFGCLTLEELGTKLEDVCELVADGNLYYFNFHEGPPGDDNGGIFLNTIRGQLA